MLHPGTFAGLREKLPYLLELGVNVVELMPIFEFDEMQDYREVDGEKLCNYWGYNTVSFFAPNTSYSASIEYNREGNELKHLIQEFNQHGIEVYLDVVFNHTAEGNEHGPFFSFKGFDNNIYYLLTPDGQYYNFSGCGNSLNCNHPIVHQMILNCLRYWVTTYHINGFRFDLASILGRNEDGSPMNKPPLLQSLAFDPILGDVKLIAEAWDAGGLYQVGTFPSWNRWAEWNGIYRDDIRRYLKGDPGMAQSATMRIVGSRDIYEAKNRQNASVNFITCHDGFTLYDLFSYNEKHNEKNGWNNTDGANDNNSWNCGVEGDTDNPEILFLRRRMMRNAFALLMCSRGIQFRKELRVLRTNVSGGIYGFPDTSFHGVAPWHDHFEEHERYAGVMFAGQDKNTGPQVIYIASNAYWESLEVTLPELPASMCWQTVADTWEEHQNTYVISGDRITVRARSVMILIGK